MHNRKRALSGRFVPDPDPGVAAGIPEWRKDRVP